MNRLRRAIFDLRILWADLRHRYGWSTEARDRAAREACRLIGEGWGGV